MFRSLLKRFAGQEAQPARAPRIPDGERVYVIGDIHGRWDLLQNLADQINIDQSGAPKLQCVTIFLGDYIDRGPHSAAVLEALASHNFPTSVVALRGNHEEIMLRFLEDETILDSWRKFGALETLHSYGVSVTSVMRGDGYKDAQASLLQALPVDHIDFLKQTPTSFVRGDYFFCHAGVRPGVPLESQISDDLLWIRDEFLRHDGTYEKMIIHGHTPVESPDIRPHRINIDTGAYASSNLTALVLEGDNRRFLSTRRR